jgi:hypothetical protein
MVPGIWFMPFSGNMNSPYFDHDIFAKLPGGAPFHNRGFSGTCIDVTHPKSQAHVTELAKRMYAWGYRYFKMDGMHTGVPSKNVYANTYYKAGSFLDSTLHDPDETHVSAYRKGIQIIRDNAPDAFLLGCNVSGNMYSMGGAFGMVDAMRIGPDNGAAGKGLWRHVTVGAWHGTNLYFLNGRIWYNDADPVYVREEIPLDASRWMCSWLAISGAMHCSSEQYPDLPEDRLDLLKRCLPSHEYPARPVDLFETNQPRIWLTGNDRVDVIGLFNWNEQEEEKIVYNMGKLGLDPSAGYVGFDYWGNRFVGPIAGTLDETLPPKGCRVLAVRKVADHPQVIGTSRHITQGLMDVIEETWDPATRTLNGRSRVIAGDGYELRIALPTTGNWEVESASLDGKTTDPGKAEKGGVRVGFQPEKSGTVDWKIGF